MVILSCSFDDTFPFVQPIGREICGGIPSTPKWLWSWCTEIMVSSTKGSIFVRHGNHVRRGCEEHQTLTAVELEKIRIMDSDPVVPCLQTPECIDEKEICMKAGYEYRSWPWFEVFSTWYLQFFDSLPDWVVPWGRFVVSHDKGRGIGKWWIFARDRSELTSFVVFVSLEYRGHFLLALTGRGHRPRGCGRVTPRDFIELPNSS